MVPRRQRPQPPHEGGQPQSRGESGERCIDPVALHDQLEWIEGNRDLADHSHLGVKTDKFPRKNILEAEAIPERRHDNKVRTTGKRILDPMGRAEYANQPSNALMLNTKAVEKLMDCQTLTGMTKGRWDTRRGW